MRANIIPIVIGGLVGLILIGGLILIFNRLGVIKNLPKQIAAPLSTTAPNKSDKFILHCPIDQKPCPLGEAVASKSVNSNFSGIGYTSLASGLKVLAALSGEVKVQTDKATGRINVTIISQQQNLQVNYAFKGTSNIQADSKNVARKEVIGFLNGELVGQKVFTKDYSLIISVLDLVTNNYIKLSSSSEGLVIKL